MLSLTKGQRTPALSQGKEVPPPAHSHSCAPWDPHHLTPFDFEGAISACQTLPRTQSLAPLPRPVQLLLPSPSVRLEQEYLHLKEAGFTINPHGFNKEQNIPNKLALFYYLFSF